MKKGKYARVLIALILAVIIFINIFPLANAQSIIKNNDNNVNKGLVKQSSQKTVKNKQQNPARELIYQLIDDLNGDTQLDTVSVWYDKNIKKYTLVINNAGYQFKETILQPISIEVVDLNTNDSYKEILFHYKTNNLEKYFIIWYNGKSIKEMLSIDAKPEVLGNGEVIIERNMGFWIKKENYILDEAKSSERTLKLSPQEFYNVGVYAYVKKPFVLYSYRDKKNKLTITKKGERIEILLCDTSNWFKESAQKNNRMFDWYLIKTERGITGWAMLKDFINLVEIIKNAEQ
mgnify:CR=1 FL=1